MTEFTARRHRPTKTSRPQNRLVKNAIIFIMSNGTVALPATVIPTLQAIGQLWNSLVKELNRKTVIRTVRTVKKIDPDQWWFWTPEWQAKERQADEDIRLGNYKTFNNVNDLIKDLHRSSKQNPK
jgi:hypothetical protein